jgi:hypothetical protein
MILCFLSLILAYFSQFDLTRFFNQMRRFLRVSLMIAKHSSFQNNLAYSLKRVHEMTTSMTLFRKSCIAAIYWFISTTNRECIEKDACNFSRLIFCQFIDFHALLEKNIFVLLFSVRLIRIEIWFDDWLRFDLILQCITRFARDSIMKIRLIVFCKLRVSQMIISIDRIRKKSRFSVKFNN